MNSKEETKILDDYYKDLIQEQKIIEKSNGRVLRAIKQVKGLEFANDLVEVFEENQTYGLFKLVRVPNGDEQEESGYGLIKSIWVDQYSVGMDGDSFAGVVSVKLKENMWLEMPFEC